MATDQGVGSSNLLTHVEKDFACSSKRNPFLSYRIRACLKIAFCKIPSQFASDFMLDLGGVVGYIDEIQHRIRCKVGRKIVGMNFQTRSRVSKTPLVQRSLLAP